MSAANLFVPTMPGSVPRCDFCMADMTGQPMEHEVRAAERITATLDTGETWIDDGRYCACKACWKLIRKNKRQKLIARAIVGTLAMHPEFRPTAEELSIVQLKLEIAYGAIFGDPGRRLQTYKIALDGKSILCLRCGMRSHNANDVRHLYCGHCHIFHPRVEAP